MDSVKMEWYIIEETSEPSVCTDNTSILSIAPENVSISFSSAYLDESLEKIAEQVDNTTAESVSLEETVSKDRTVNKVLSFEEACLVESLDDNE